jgi:photosystem II core protein PsbZ
MTLIIQILTSILILLSLFLVIAIPVALAQKTEWEQSSGKYLRLSQLWLALVGATGIVASLAK